MFKVTNCELNASTAKAIAGRVMKDRNMRVTEKFVPADSQYLVNLSPTTRLRINLSNNHLVCLEEMKIGNKHFISGIKEVKGSFDKVQKAFYDLVSDINKIISM